jgi:phenylacetate-CoA ligase
VDNPDGADRMTLRCESAGGDVALAEAVAASIREVTKLRGEAAFCAPGSLPNDGRVIEDVREYR